MNFPLNHVHPNAKIEKDVTIGPFTTIAENVQIGEGTYIGSNVTILPGARIGRFCQIFSGAVIAAIPQDCKFKGEDTYAYIGDYTIIRECVTISRGTAAGPNTIIGKHVLLMAYVHIAHDCLVEDYCILANAVQVAGHVHIGVHAKIGGTAAIRQFVKVGSYAMVAGGSLVRKDVPPFVKAAREPLQYCGLNVVGLQRSGFTAHQIRVIQHIYQLIFQKALPLAAALEQVRINTPPCSEKDMIIDFISHASLGIIRPRLL
jgi:UDP-N-acetylglucosamine acyltransferase